MEPNRQFVSEEQLVYAGWLDTGMKIGFVLLLGTFLVYLSGLTAPHVPMTELPLYWSMPVNEYLRAANVHTGWSWLSLVGKGDFMNFIGIAFLSDGDGLTGADRDHVYFAIEFLFKVRQDRRKQTRIRRACRRRETQRACAGCRLRWRRSWRISGLGRGGWRGRARHSDKCQKRDQNSKRESLHHFFSWI